MVDLTYVCDEFALVAADLLSHGPDGCVVTEEDGYTGDIFKLLWDLGFIDCLYGSSEDLSREGIISPEVYPENTRILAAHLKPEKRADLEALVVEVRHRGLSGRPN